MTQVDFYILKGDSDEARLALACRIAEEAMQQDRGVYIHTESRGQSLALDKLLWTFSPGSFVPHRVLGAPPDGSAAQAAPVLIGHGAEPAGEPWDLLINLDAAVPEFFSRYERVAEVVDAHAERRERGRDRYRWYRDRGYPLQTHQM